VKHGDCTMPSIAKAATSTTSSPPASLTRSSTSIRTVSGTSALVYYSSCRLPTCVLGDQMQAVFGFSGPLSDWDTHVCKCFQSATELTTPGRWKNAGTEPFGRWLLNVRKALKDGDAVDLNISLPRSDQLPERAPVD